MWLSPSNIFTANRAHAYSPLESTEHKHVVLTKRRRLLTCGIFAVLSLWSVGLLATSYSVYSAKGGSTSRPYLYTPMEDAIEYEVRHFNQGLWGDRTTFMGSPNATNHEAWRTIRRLGIIKLSSEQASRVPGPPSILYPGHPDVWQGGIEMFHQLHCLYHLRMLIYAKKPEIYYGRDSTVDEQAAHTDHCIDHLQQAIMCAGNAEIITFRRDSKRRMMPNFDGPKVCRKWEPLRKWAEENKAWNITPEGPEEDMDRY